MGFDSMPGPTTEHSELDSGIQKMLDSLKVGGPHPELLEGEIFLGNYGIIQPGERDEDGEVLAMKNLESGYKSLRKGTVIDGMYPVFVSKDEYDQRQASRPPLAY